MSSWRRHLRRRHPQRRRRHPYHPPSGAALGMILPVGGFLTLGVVIAVAQYLLSRPKKNKEVAK